jgi:hypothetical protein
MSEITTTTHRQYVDRPQQTEQDLIERYKVISTDGDELYVSMLYVEDGETESRYEPDRKGWEYGLEIDESQLPVGHLEELSDIREKLSEPESVSQEPEKGKIKM